MSRAHALRSCLFLCLSLAACGGDAENNGGEPPVPEPVPSTKKTVVEVEPNEDKFKATPLGDALIVEGAFGQAQDADYYFIKLEQGDVLEVAIKDVSSMLPEGISVNFLSYEQDEEYDGKTLVGSAGVTRQFFVPVASTYILRVVDARVEKEGMEDQATGSEDHTYTLEFDVKALSPTEHTPGTDIKGDFNAGKLGAFSFSVTDKSVFRVGATAAGKGDPVLYILDSKTNEIVVQADDLNFAEDKLDAYAELNALTDVEYIAVVDFYGNTADLPYTFHTHILEDGAHTPTEDAADLGYTFSGVISSPDAIANLPDYDYFYVTLPSIDDQYMVNVKAKPGSSLNPSITRFLVDKNGTWKSAKVVRGENGEASMPISGSFSLDSETFLDFVVVVSDDGVYESPSVLRGGTDYTYDLTITK